MIGWAARTIMPRDQHSPSSNALGHRCEAAWARVYVDGVRDEPREWDDETADARQRAAGLGTAMHSIAEDYFSFREIGERWESRPGMLAARLLEHAPPRGPGVKAEGEVFLVHNGIKWRGLVDLTDKRQEAIADVYDWKSTSDINAWAKTPAELAYDLAAALYATYTAGGFSAEWDHVRGRWVYVQTRGTARTLPVDFVITREAARAILDRESEFAAHLDTIESFATARKNPLACHDFGATCQHHKSRGGPCDPVPNKYAPGALVALGPPQRKKRTDTSMQVLTPNNGATPLGQAGVSARTRFADRAGAATAPPQTVPPATEPAAIETTGEVPEPTPTRAPRTPRARPTAAPVHPPEPTDAPPMTEAGANVVKLASEFAAADVACTVASARLEQTRDAHDRAEGEFAAATAKRVQASRALAEALA